MFLLWFFPFADVCGLSVNLVLTFLFAGVFRLCCFSIAGGYFLLFFLESLVLVFVSGVFFYLCCFLSRIGVVALFFFFAAASVFLF